MSIFIGIDPGWSGAISSFSNRRTEIFKCPETYEKIVDLLKFLSDGEKNKYAVIEKVHGRGEKGGKGVRWAAEKTFRFGENYGNWLSALYSCGFHIEKVEPQKWQGLLLGKFPAGMSKEISLRRAKTKHPELISTIGQNHNKADASNLMDLCIMWIVK